MDKKIILSVAGSGKTEYAIKKINLEDKFLLLTYTDNNYLNLKERIVKKFGYLPNNVKIYKYYSFLYNFFFKPLLFYSFPAKEIDFNSRAGKYIKGTDDKYFINPINNKLYSYRMSKLLLDRVKDDCIKRLNKYFDYIIVDEVQDFSANDFNFLEIFCNSTDNVLFIGDFYQHTYDSSTDGMVKKNLYKCSDKYIKELKKFGLSIDVTTLQKSYRCSSSVCKFIEKKLGIDIKSHNEKDSEIRLVENEKEIDNIMKNGEIVKLFFQKHYEYGSFSNNWGNSKGCDCYNDVCVILNNTTTKFFPCELKSLSPNNKSKLYVAITRAKNNVYFVKESQIKKYKSNNKK
ncbi:MAG: UvrD-helicase domain-containing protein [Alphaproteobacteria bacterium]|nr:UvrD-helicase domain-containing protein [Alphaproteobacteria bacterium]